MPRVSEAEKRKSHERILQAAAGLFREQGIENTSVSDVMKAAGMTHGGFYRHFEGKDDLAADAVQKAVSDVVSDMEAASKDEAMVQARAAYIETYLSENHLNNSRDGCPLAALGPELARADGVRREGADATDRVTSLLSDDSEKGRAMLALLVGSVTLARLYDDPEKARAVLAAAKEALALIDAT